MAWAAQAAAGASFDAWQRTPLIGAPTLVLHGTEDVVVDPANAALLGERIPDARVELFEGCGHLLFWEDPDRFVEVVGVPVVNGEHTLGRWLADRARNTPGRVAIDAGDTLVTYGELHARSSRMAAALVARGLGRGDRVATLTPNSADHVALLFACARLGLALQPLNWRLLPSELRYQLGDAEPSLLAADPVYAELAAETGHGVPRVVLSDLDDEGPVPAGDVRDDDPLLLAYTSGTTASRRAQC